MGKKNKTDPINEMTWMYDNPNKADDLASRYGIDRNDYGFSRNDSGNPKKRPDEFARDIAAAASKDPSTFNYLQAKALAGNKRAEEIGGIDTIDEAQRAHKMMRKDHEGGGAFTSANDYFNVTLEAVKQERAKKEKELDDKYASIVSLEEMREELEARNASADPVEAPELSETLVQAQEESDEFSLDLGSIGDNLFGSTETDEDNLTSEEEDYKNKYSANVKGGLKLAGITTRGPGSGINGGGF